MLCLTLTSTGSDVSNSRLIRTWSIRRIDATLQTGRFLKVGRAVLTNVTKRRRCRLLPRRRRRRWWRRRVTVEVDTQRLSIFLQAL